MVTTKKDVKVKGVKKYFVGPNKLLPADYVFMVILALLAATIILPFMNVISISFSSDVAVNSNPAMMVPHDFQIVAYKAILRSTALLRSMGLTVLYVVAFVSLRLLTSVFAGYALSITGLPGKKVLSTYLLIPMFFSGGLVPTYIIINQLGLMNNVLVLILPGCVNVTHVLIMRTFIKGIPQEMDEAARIDGANTVQLLFRIIIPMCIPALCTIGMIAGIQKWNDWSMAFYYIPDKTYLYPLQNWVREIVLQLDSTSKNELSIAATQFGSSLKMALIIITTLPIVVVYPFLQKYFEQGLMIGSVKG